MAAVVVAGCGGGGKPKPAATSTSASVTFVTEAPTTTALAAGAAPLTGLPGDPAKLGRPALIVKIDNAPAARPQAGLNQADIVVEEMVEGGITRFATIFQSGDADPVGPIRSARTTDIMLASALNHPLLSYSGANADFEKLINAAPLVNLSPAHFPSGYHRAGAHPPYNDFSSTPLLFGRTPAGATPPPAQFTYRGAGQAVTGGAAVHGLHVEFHGPHIITSVDWAWDAGAGVWKRSENGTMHVDQAGQQVTAKNIVIEFVPYKDTGYRDRANSPVPEAQLVGSGEAWVFTDGQVVKGRWAKASADAVAHITVADGTAIGLTPGRTWVELPEPGGAKELP